MQEKKKRGRIELWDFALKT